MACKQLKNPNLEHFQPNLLQRLSKADKIEIPEVVWAWWSSTYLFVAVVRLVVYWNEMNSKIYWQEI